MKLQRAQRRVFAPALTPRDVDVLIALTEPEGGSARESDVRRAHEKLRAMRRTMP